MARETLIQMRQGGITSWASNNPVLAAGEFAVATDINLIKVGDGTTTFNNLGFFANTLYTNTFGVGQQISLTKTNVPGLRITHGMRYAFISSALFASNGAQVTYTYATNGGGLSGGLISVGDYVTVVGFSNGTFNYANAQVTVVTTGEFPTFTITGSGVPSSSATGNSNTWFYETTTGKADLLRVSTMGPGGGAGSSQVETAFKISGGGSATFTGGVTMDGTLSVGGNATIVGNIAHEGDFSTSITFSGTSVGMTLNTATYNSSARITGTATTSTSGTAMLESKAASTSTNYHQFFSDTSGIIGRVRTTGGTIYFENVSDYRLKENVVPIEDAVEKVKALKPSRFNFKHVPETTVDGFIAHEVAAIVPMAVSGEKDGVNEDGDPEYQSLDASKLIPVLTAALQDALKRIEVLEKKVK
jgi:hypothetical protein